MIAALLQAIPDAGTVKTTADWLADGYTLAAAIAIVFGGAIFFLAKRLMSISDAAEAERKKYLEELMTRRNST
jgi:hypothetical protein